MASSISVLAGILLKMNRSQAVTEDELQQLAAFASQATAVEATAAGAATATATATAAAPKPAPKATKKIVKKIQEATAAERALLDPVEFEGSSSRQTDIEKSYKINTISPSLCQARKVNDKEFIPGTEPNKVYAEIQCTRKKATGSDFCKFCGATEEKWRTGGQKEKKWAGRVTEPVPDHIHVVGSAWYKQKYPQGLNVSRKVTMPIEPPVTDVVLDDSLPIQVIEWEAFTFQGTPMIRHMADGRVYKADMSKVGAERILFDHYQGRWEDDDLNIYALETDEEESDD